MASGQAALRVGEVFVAGGMPTVTYHPRRQLQLEQSVEEYLDERRRILSISGPTKTGKTVLVRNVLGDDPAIYLSGGIIKSVDDFWGGIADALEIATTVESSRQTTDTELCEASGQLSLLSVATGGVKTQGSIGRQSGSRTSRTRSASAAARNALQANPVPVVIDDFHYISPPVQADIVRGLKDLVFFGLPVIIVSVPHRAYDAVRVEKEMTGRIQQLQIGFWSNSELVEIARKGFGALGLKDEFDVASRLAAESFASPHLMQDFCLHVCKSSGIRVKQLGMPTLQPPLWTPFFEERAIAASKHDFDKLARGPRQRTDRKPRRMKSGLIVDIYGAVLLAISRTGPLAQVSYEALRASLRELLADELPQRHEVTRVLEEIAKIARAEPDGEPIVDYDEEMSTLHISDPYFSFFLKWRAEKSLEERAFQISDVAPDDVRNVFYNVGGNVVQSGSIIGGPVVSGGDR